ncbi:MAG: urease accessory protein UreH domain-containing protein [Promethearchaeota archaeon]
MQEYFIIFLPAFFLGILHTFIPCEDKAILLFWSLGISKTPKKSLLILVLYGMGLIIANLSIAFATVLISIIPRIIFPESMFDTHAIIFFGALSSTFAAIFLLFLLTNINYMPHSRSKEIKLIQNLNWEKLRTPLFVGILAGFPPCIFELFIYSQCLTLSLSYGYVEGVLSVFYFALGTVVGIFPLALAKQSTQYIIKTRDSRRTKIFVAMLIIIIVFNTIIMILSFLRINIFPY